MTDKIVTHEDLPTLRNIRTEVCRPNNHPTGCTCPGSNLLNRLIAAAEADQPPLPEGWVLHNTTSGWEALWHEDGVLYRHNMLGGGALGDVGEEPYFLSRLTPLRPTVTEADVEKAARAARAYFEGSDTWDTEPRHIRDPWMGTVRAAIDALGIEEVQR